MDTGYIHGFSPAEQQRLIAQAQILAPGVMPGLDLAGARRLLEIGCGVGAELKLLADRWPGLHLTGLDLSLTHLRAARAHLAPEISARAVSILRGNALCLPMADGSFDRVITIWMLEHVQDPIPVLAEALRVLQPGGWLVCTEVDNATFGFEPMQPAIAEWWEGFNRCQLLDGGDPFVGGKLGRAAKQLGCSDIRTERLPVISSRREPERRSVLLEYLRHLLLSGREDLMRRGLADMDLLARLEAELDGAMQDPCIHFHYSAVRLRCRPAG